MNRATPPANLEAYAVAAVEAVGCLWRVEPRLGRLSLSGDAASLGLDPHDLQDALPDLVHAARPEERATLDAELRRGAPGAAFGFRLHLGPSSIPSLWRGRWDADGATAEGVALPDVAPAEATGREPLTGLLDRAGLLERLTARLEGPGGVRLIVADLARFRRLNAALGVECGDLVLAALGGRLAAAYAPANAPARIGDDEFAVILDAGEDDAATALRSVLERPLRLAGCDIHPSFAVGSAQRAPGEALTASDLLSRAGQALDAARTEAAGGAGDAAAADGGLRRLSLEADIRGALGRGEIEAFYQPVVTLADGRIAGFEALARWRHPRRGLLGPDDFIPLMGEARLTAGLGRMMMRKAAAQLALWRAAGWGELFVSVNLTAAELERPGVVAEVGAVIAEAGLPPGALKLELTEGEVMRDPEGAAAVLRELRDAGAGIAVDDFGMGFSSLSYLTRLPVSVLKIDRYFVRAMGGSAEAATVIRSVAALGRDLGLDIVAEGVEGLDAVPVLAAMGCRYGQGFAFAPPLPVEEADAHLAARRWR